MVRMGGVVVRTRWWWWWGCAFAKREAQSEWAKKTETERPWLGFGLQWDCKRRRGGLCGYSPPSRAKLEGGMGGEWYGGWWWLCLPAALVPLLFLFFFSTHSPPSSTLTLLTAHWWAV